jgi:hypothetical protein
MLHIDPRQRGYHVLYYAGENMHCPGCGHSNWFVGRTMAECAFCTTALPMADEAARESRPAPIPAFVPAMPLDEWQPLFS